MNPTSFRTTAPPRPQEHARPQTPPLHVGYVVKRYPRFSETFIVNEILAHEAAGTRVSIFSLRPPVDTHFQAELARVRAPVTYLSGARSVRSRDLWRALRTLRGELADEGRWEGSGGRGLLDLLQEEEVTTAYQAMQLAGEVRAQGIHHLHAHFATSPTDVARLAAQLAGVRYSMTAHAKDIFHESVSHAALRRKLSEAAAVVTVSDFNVADLRRRFGPAASSLRRIYNGLDLEQFPFRRPPVESAQPLILGVGRLVEKKGFDHLLGACGILRERGRPFHCRIVGGGDLEDDLRRRIAELQLDDAVTLTGPLPREVVVEMLGSAAVLAAPCVAGSDGNRDGLPTVLLEAMALGVPCVSTRVTGIPELIENEVTGLLVGPADMSSGGGSELHRTLPGELASALERLMDDPTLGRSLAIRGRERIERDFDVRRSTEKLRALFVDAAREASHAA